MREELNFFTVVNTFASSLFHETITDRYTYVADITSKLRFELNPQNILLVPLTLHWWISLKQILAGAKVFCLLFLKMNNEMIENTVNILYNFEIQ